MSKQPFLHIIPAIISDLIRASRAGEAVGDIVNRTLEMLYIREVFDNVTFFSMDTVSFNFQPRYTYPKDNSPEEKDEIFQQLIENGTIANVLQNIQPIICQLDSSTHAAIIPVIASTIIEGLLLAEFPSEDYQIDSDDNPSILLILGASLGAQIEIVNLSVELKTTQLFVEQKVAAQTLLINQTRLKLKSIIDNVLIGIVLVDAHTHSIVEANTAALTLIGSSQEDVLHKNIDNFLQFIDNEYIESNQSLVVREAALIKYDGVILPLMRSSTIVNLDGREYVVESFIDISERKEFEEKLHRVNLSLDEQVKKRTKELEKIVSRLESEISERNKIQQALFDSENMLSLIFDTVGIGLCLSDNGGDIIRINKEFGNIFDINETHCNQNNLLQMIQYQNVKGWENLTIESFYDTVNGTTVEIQTPIKKKFIFITTSRLMREDNTIYYVTTVTDITVQKEAEADILKLLVKEKELHDLKTNFISMISHEFRTPLTTILSYAQLLKKYRQQWSDEQHELYLDNIEIGVKRMTNLLNDALLIGQSQSGFLMFNPQECDVNKLVEDVIHDLIASYDFKREIQYSVDMIQKNVVIDEKLMRQVLYNLVSNSLKYSFPETVVEVKVSLISNQLHVVVKDKGIGIPEKYLQEGRIFEAFVRADNVGNVSGTGLGMAIIKNAVDLQNGTIHVESTQNIGTKISVTIPITMKVQK
ncbi:MAG TPA: ATP-binding protein [Candidatus Kapabacteria bacterium]|nr:ATP-binding protein [Candidatus Kapabacteria bacterium]